MPKLCVAESEVSHKNMANLVWQAGQVDKHGDNSSIFGVFPDFFEAAGNTPSHDVLPTVPEPKIRQGLPGDLLAFTFGPGFDGLCISNVQKCTLW